MDKREIKMDNLKIHFVNTSSPKLIYFSQSIFYYLNQKNNKIKTEHIIYIPLKFQVNKVFINPQIIPNIKAQFKNTV